MKLSELKINPKNPRIIKDDRFMKLVKSVQEFPKMMKLRPIVIDNAGVVLGGNMRLKALQHLKYKEIPDEWVKRADELTEEEKQRFIVSDNVGVGDWNWDDLANEWDAVKLEEWGLELPGFDVSPDDFGEGFSLPDGDKSPFQQMTFTLADEQAVLIQNCIADVKRTDEYKYMETAGNENSNGNALFLIVSQWDAQRK
jgi:hypothetical protein